MCRVLWWVCFSPRSEGDGGSYCQASTEHCASVHGMAGADENVE